MSFIYSRNNNGPNIEPCGTPAEILYHSDDVPSMTTRCISYSVYY